MTGAFVAAGARLGKLVEALREHSLEWVAALDPRYAGTLGRSSWVASIVIARIDKGASVLGYSGWRLGGCSPNPAVNIRAIKSLRGRVDRIGRWYSTSQITEPCSLSVTTILIHLGADQ